LQIVVLRISLILEVVTFVKKIERKVIKNMISLLQNIDNSILLFIENNMHGNIMDKAMVIITSLGNEGAIWIIIAALLMINKKYRKIGFMCIILQMY